MTTRPAAPPDLAGDELWALLNAQTARVAWSELAPHHRRGAVIQVATDLDLVAVAVAVVGDDRAAVEAWMHAGELRPPRGETVAAWDAADARLWAVVTPPWVLVQETSP